jgi:hypothetical protein
MALPNGSDVAGVLSAIRPPQSQQASSAKRTPAASEQQALTSAKAPAASEQQALTSAKAPAAPAQTGQAPPQGPPAPPQGPPAPPQAPPPAPSSKVLDFTFQLQVNGYYCGPAATRIALTARGKTPSQDEVARSLGTTVYGTNSAEDTTRALNSMGDAPVYQTHTIPGGSATPAQMGQLQSDVVHAITNGYVVVANIVGNGLDLDGGWHGYGGGHYVTVVGYRDDGRTVKVADPANTNGDGTYWMTTINFANWMAHRGYSA